MIIICKFATVFLNDGMGKPYPYKNRYINLNNIVTFGESTASTGISTGNSVTYPSIKFTSVTRRGDAAQIYEWIFETEEARDQTLKEIEKVSGAREC